MISATWLINTTKGPAAGSADCDDVDAAWTALTSAWKEAVGPSWGPDHEGPLRQLEAEARTALATADRWSHVATAVVITLTRTG